MSEAAPKTGLFLCRCGTNIAGFIDLDAIASWARANPHIAFVETHDLLCSPAGKAFVEKTLREQQTPSSSQSTPQQTSPLDRLQVQEATLRVAKQRADLEKAQREQQTPSSSQSTPQQTSPLDRLKLQEATLRVAKQRADLEKALREQHEDRQPAQPTSTQPSAFDRLKLRQLLAEVRITEEKARQAELEAAQPPHSAGPASAPSDRKELISAQREQLALRSDQLKLSIAQYEFEQKQLENEHDRKPPSAEEAAAKAYERQKQRMELQKMAIELRTEEQKALAALRGPTEREQQAEALTARQNDLKLRRDLVTLQTEQMKALTARQQAREVGSLAHSKLELDRQRLELDRKKTDLEIAKLEKQDFVKQGEMLQMQFEAQTARAKAEADNAKAAKAMTELKLAEQRALEGFRQQQAALEIERDALRNAQEELKLRNAQDVRRAKGPSDDDLSVLNALLEDKTGTGGRIVFRDILRSVYIGDLWDPETLQYFVTSTFFSVWVTVLANVNNKAVTRRLTMRDTIEDTELQVRFANVLAKNYNNMRRGAMGVSSTTGWEVSGLVAGSGLDAFMYWLRDQYGGRSSRSGLISPFLQLNGRNPYENIPLVLESSSSIEKQQQDLLYHLRFTPKIPLVIVPNNSRNRHSAYLGSAL